MKEILFLYLKEIGLKDTTDLIISFIGIVVAFLGIIVTGVFSYLLWLSAQRTNTLTELNLTLAQTINENQEKREKNIRKQYRNDVIYILSKYRTILRRQVDEKELTLYGVQAINEQGGFLKENLAKYFTTVEVEKINQINDAIYELEDKHLMKRNRVAYYFASNPDIVLQLREIIDEIDNINNILIQDNQEGNF
ncbi:hypothetical protein M4D76_24500 [Peribacillus frigoritolerans]|uniref:hypothetical protein n=1 Tax=Peribacillus frigoritolerans TaxID=450367 RepID=UPI0021A2F257|nr:hypothetical protein [Peribacillus frigoritolerans]MCT1391427.1 hypothetical protein [Peribacillus frigoritolerans]